MKKFLLLLLLACGFFSSSFGVAISDGDIVPIPLMPKPPGRPHQPRTVLPITAYDVARGVDLQFPDDLGVVSVTVVNQTSGEQWLESVETISGCAHIETATTESAGDYLIYVVLEDGTTYCGEFFR